MLDECPGRLHFSVTIEGTTMRGMMITMSASHHRAIRYAHRLARIGLVILSGLLACMLGLTALLLILSPGKPKPFVDENGKVLPGSISEKVFVTINGVRQGMFIASKDTTQPVLLYLHGGMPDYFLSKRYPTGLEEAFTVVWWEMRGSGLSYDPNVPLETITVEHRIEDTLEVTNYLRQRFGHDKIYLMAHSGGTFIAIQAAARAPEMYGAYIGVAQISNQLESERLAYEFMLQQFSADGNTKMVRKLEAAPVTMTGGIPPGYVVVRDPAMHRLGIGTTHEMRSVITGVFLRSLADQDYTLPEKVNMWRAKFQSGVSLGWDEVVTTDLRAKVTELQIPVYFFHGIYDYTVSYTLAKDYFERLQAPVKGFYTFEQSAHSPIFEEPKIAQRILREDVLKGRNSLADAQELFRSPSSGPR
jgi:pimeloyl-ACP methyl ester carboxylesterase